MNGIDHVDVSEFKTSRRVIHDLRPTCGAYLVNVRSKVSNNY